MKIDRRSFLSLVVGGAAGTALTPLPWKLTDDLSIWTQNWPWTPVPADGEASYTRSACTLCTGGCGIDVRKIDERVVKIEGLADHPVNNGGICPLGLSGPQLLYSPRRIRQPMVKENGKWKPISWDEAIDIVVGKLAPLRDAKETHTVAGITGQGRSTVSALFERFLTAYGSPNFLRTGSFQDSYELALRLMHGDDANVVFDLKNSDFVVSFGSNLIEGWGSPVQSIQAHSLWKDKNVTTIQVEPRLSATAAKANKWIPIHPGTEGVLALGICQVLLSESLVKKDFIEKYTSGFDAFSDLLKKEYSPETVAGITGIEKGTIASIARGFAKASAPIALTGRGQGSRPSGVKENMAVHALNLLAGNINKKGGVWTVSSESNVNWGPVETDEVSKAGFQKERVDGAGTGKAPVAGSLPHRLVFPKYPLNVLFVADNANPSYTFCDTEAVAKAFDKIPFIVSFSSWYNETTEKAHLLLPNHIYLERAEDVPFPSGVATGVIGLSKPVISPVCNTRHTGDVLIQIAQKMAEAVAGAFSWESFEACLTETYKDDWKALQENGFVEKSDFGPTPLDSAKKIDLTGQGIIAGKNEISPEGSDTAFPLTLVPFDSLRRTPGPLGDSPFMMKTVEDTVLKKEDLIVEVNPKTAKVQGLKDGGYATLSTPKGKAKVRVRFYEGILPGVVGIPSGLGHTGEDVYISGKGVNVNKLIGPVEDPVSGLDVAWGIRAKLS